MCVCVDDGGNDVFPIRLDKTISRVKDGEQVYITWLGVGRRGALHAGQPNRSESLLARCQHDA